MLSKHGFILFMPSKQFYKATEQVKVSKNVYSLNL